MSILRKIKDNCVKILYGKTNDYNRNEERINDSGLEDYAFDFFVKLCKITNLDGKKILEIGCGNGDLLKYIGSKCNILSGIGIDPYLHEWWNTDEYEDGNIKIIDGTGEALPFENEEFDIVISVATFEHVENVEGCLKEIYRVLKNKGEFFTDFGPVWSGILGHHWCHSTKEEVLKIPPWAHLYMTYEEMKKHITQITSEANAEQMCQYIYHSNLINRVDCKHFRKCFESSGFDTINIKENRIRNRLQWLTGNDENELDEITYKKLKDKYSEKELEIISYDVHLIK